MNRLSWRCSYHPQRSATPDAGVVSVGAESFEPGAALSPAVRSAIPSAARAVLAAVRAGPWRSADA